MLARKSILTKPSITQPCVSTGGRIPKTCGRKSFCVYYTIAFPPCQEACIVSQFPLQTDILIFCNTAYGHIIQAGLRPENNVPSSLGTHSHVFSASNHLIFCSKYRLFFSLSFFMEIIPPPIVQSGGWCIVTLNGWFCKIFGKYLYLNNTHKSMCITV